MGRTSGSFDYHLFFFERKGKYMTICLLGLRFTGTITLLYCIYILIEDMRVGMDLRFVIHCIVLGITYLFLSDVGEVNPILSFILKLVLLFGHIRLYYHNREKTVLEVYLLHMCYGNFCIL